MEEGVSGDHGGVGGYLFDCEHGVFVALTCPIVAQVDLGHRSLPKHVRVVDLVLVQHQESPLRTH